MFARWREAGLIVPAILSLLLLPLLIGLGNWQWHRKAWKEDLIAKIEARRTAEPISYPEALSRFVKTGDVEYLHVRVTGTFDHAQEHHLYAPTQQSQGWDIITPLRPAGGLPPLLVNRGWVPDSLKDPSKRAAGQPADPVTITGLVRLPESKSWFAPESDLAGNRWYWRDVIGMEEGHPPAPAEVGFPASKHQSFAPFSLDADASPENPGGWPKGGTTVINLPNSHLQYVVTWYALAATLIAVFAVFARQRLKELESKAEQR